MAKAIASDVLESIISSILSLAHIKLEKILHLLFYELLLVLN